MSPGVAGAKMLSTTMALAPAARVARSQWTLGCADVEVSRQLPWLGVKAGWPVPAGSWSSRITPVAGPGPALATVTV